MPPNRHHLLIAFLLITAFLALFAFCPRAHSAPITTLQAYTYLLHLEGYKITPYRDGNQWCAGLGHVIRGPRKPLYRDEEIFAWFDADFEDAVRICRKGVKHFDDLPEDAQLVSIGLVWTTGATGFMRFKDFRKHLSKQRFKRAADALKQSKWWNQVKEGRAQDAYDRLLALD